MPHPIDSIDAAEISAILEEYPNIPLDDPASLVRLALALEEEDDEEESRYGTVFDQLDACVQLVDRRFAAQPFAWHVARYALRFGADGAERFEPPAQRADHTFFRRREPPVALPAFDPDLLKLASAARALSPSPSFALEGLSLKQGGDHDQTAVSQHLQAHASEPACRRWALRHVGCLSASLGDLRLDSPQAVLESLRQAVDQPRVGPLAPAQVGGLLEHLAGPPLVDALKGLLALRASPTEDNWEAAQRRRAVESLFEACSINLAALAKRLVRDPKMEAQVLDALGEPALLDVLLSTLDSEFLDHLGAERPAFVAKLIEHTPSIILLALEKRRPTDQPPAWLKDADPLVAPLIASALRADRLILAMHFIDTADARAQIPTLILRLDNDCDAVTALIDHVPGVPVAAWLAALDQPTVADAVVGAMGASRRLLAFARLHTPTRDRLRALPPEQVWRQPVCPLLFDPLPPAHRAWFETDAGRPYAWNLLQVGTAEAHALYSALYPDRPPALHATQVGSAARAKALATLPAESVPEALRTVSRRFSAAEAQFLWEHLPQALGRAYLTIGSLAVVVAELLAAETLTWAEAVDRIRSTPAALDKVNRLNIHHDWEAPQRAKAVLDAVKLLPSQRRVRLIREIYAHQTRGRVIPALADLLPRESDLGEALRASRRDGSEHREQPYPEVPPANVLQAVRRLALPALADPRPDAGLLPIDRPLCLAGQIASLEAQAARGLPAEPPLLDDVLEDLRAELLRRALVPVEGTAIEASVRAHLADRWPTRAAVERALQAAGVAKRQLVLDRLNDEWSPRLLRAALSAWLAEEDLTLAAPEATLAAQLFHRVVDRYADQPAVLARALLAHTRAQGEPRPERLRGVMMALGHLRESLGGRVPRRLAALAADQSQPEAVRGTAETRKKLFDRNTINKGRHRRATRRVEVARQALIRAEGLAQRPSTAR